MAQGKALSFLTRPAKIERNEPDNGFPQGSPGGNENESGEASGGIGSGARPHDAGTIDPVQITEKRGRGRPRKSAAERRERKRTTAAKKRRSASEEKEPLSVDGEPVAEPEPPEVPATVVAQFAFILTFAHSRFPPEFHLDNETAMALAKAILNVARYFIRVSFVVSNKWSAILALAMTAWAVYAPRFGAYNERLAMEAKLKREQAPAPPVDQEMMVAN
jgi:hypothetical protein